MLRAVFDDSWMSESASTRSSRLSDTSRRRDSRYSIAWRRPRSWGELINTANACSARRRQSRKSSCCLAKWYAEDLGHPEYAQPYYHQIMALDPNNVQVLRQIAAIHRLGGQWQKMGETLTRALEVAVANEDRKAILVDLGELLGKHMGNVEQGIVFYRRALETDALYLPALEALERIYDHAPITCSWWTS